MKNSSEIHALSPDIISQNMDEDKLSTLQRVLTLKRHYQGAWANLQELLKKVIQLRTEESSRIKCAELDTARLNMENAILRGLLSQAQSFIEEVSREDVMPALACEIDSVLTQKTEPQTLIARIVDFDVLLSHPNMSVVSKVAAIIVTKWNKTIKEHIVEAFQDQAPCYKVGKIVVFEEGHWIARIMWCGEEDTPSGTPYWEFYGLDMRIYENGVNFDLSEYTDEYMVQSPSDTQ